MDKSRKDLLEYYNNKSALDTDQLYNYFYLLAYDQIASMGNYLFTTIRRERHHGPRRLRPLHDLSQLNSPTPQTQPLKIQSHPQISTLTLHQVTDQSQQTRIPLLHAVYPPRVQSRINLHHPLIIKLGINF